MQSRERYFPFSGGPRSELRGSRTNAPYIVEFYQKINTPYIEQRREYQSLCLDHFKTPRHVLDHIRDSGLSLV